MYILVLISNNIIFVRLLMLGYYSDDPLNYGMSIESEAQKLNIPQRL